MVGFFSWIKNQWIFLKTFPQQDVLGMEIRSMKLHRHKEIACGTTMHDLSVECLKILNVRWVIHAVPFQHTVYFHTKWGERESRGEMDKVEAKVRLSTKRNTQKRWEQDQGGRTERRGWERREKRKKRGRDKRQTRRARVWKIEWLVFLTFTHNSLF